MDKLEQVGRFMDGRLCRRRRQHAEILANHAFALQTKTEYANEDAIVDDTAAQAYVEQFAQETLDRAERVIKANKVTLQTASTFDAALTFLNLVNIWGPPDAETQQKIKYAKWNAARITKALKEGKDPNESNPKKEDLPPQQPALDPMDLEVQFLGSTAEGRKPASVEGAPDPNLHKDSAGVSLPQSPATGLPSAPDEDILKLPSAPGYEEASTPSVPSGYFDPPPALPSPISPPTQTPSNYTPAPDHASTGRDWTPTPPPGTTLFPPPASGSTATPSNPPTFAPSQPPTAAFASPPASSASNPSYADAPPPANISRPVIPPPSNRVVPVAPTAPGGLSQVPQQVTGNFITDDMAMSQAQKHAKWAISALNFEDVPTAVSELRRALEALGAT